jgi:hypothetical protein
MAKFVHIDGFYINPELVIYIQGDSDPSEPVCGIYLPLCAVPEHGIQCSSGRQTPVPIFRNVNW